jgi:hypothetical protein
MWQNMATSANYNKIKNQKSSFTKTIFTRKIIFKKDDFELVHFSNKHEKSHVWAKVAKKCIF